MKIYTVLFIFSVLALAACEEPKQEARFDIHGTWRMYDILPAKKGSLNFDEEASLKDGLKSGIMISLFKDSTLTMISDSTFMYGKWAYAEGSDFLEFFRDKETDTIKIYLQKNEVISNEVNLSLISGKSKQLFVQEVRALDQPYNDPYHLVNNHWRVKADSAENNDSLKKRISNYIKHLALVLKASEERQEQSVDFTYSKGPVKIYSGGIGILPYDLTPGSWKSTFHNDSNALEAYHLYEKCLRRGSYKGASSGSWVKDDYNILMHIYSGLQQ